jgi:hypothetical protein
MRVVGLTRVFAEVFEGLAQKCFAGSGFEGRLSVVYGGEITVLSLRTPRWILASGESILQGLKPFSMLLGRAKPEGLAYLEAGRAFAR